MQFVILEERSDEESRGYAKVSLGRGGNAGESGVKGRPIFAFWE